MTDRCAIHRCRGEVELVYLDQGICGDCWRRFTTGDAPHDALRRALGIEDAPPATEEPMEQETTNATAEADGQNAPAESPAEENEEMATKTTKRKRTTKKQATARKTTTKKKPAKPKTKAAGDKPNRVFAIRVTDAELAAIHKAAGPRNATRFVRAVAAAFAAGDDAAFRAVVKEAREQRG